MDIRTEAAWTDPPRPQSFSGQFMYWEYIQSQGYTNAGQIFGDWVGREGKGSQLWIAYHLNGNEWIEANARNHKVASNFIPGGTSINDFGVNVIKRIKKDFQIDVDLTIENWKAPVFLAGQHTVTSASVKVGWYPSNKVRIRPAN